MRYRSTTVRLNASRGSEQYHATNSRIAWSYVRWPLADVRLLSTAVLACSRSGSASTRLGGFFFRDFGFGIGDGLLWRGRQLRRTFPCGVSHYESPELPASPIIAATFCESRS